MLVKASEVEVAINLTTRREAMAERVVTETAHKKLRVGAGNKGPSRALLPAQGAFKAIARTEDTISAWSRGSWRLTDSRMMRLANSGVSGCNPW